MVNLNFDFAGRTVTVSGARDLRADVSSTGVVLPVDDGMPM